MFNFALVVSTITTIFDPFRNDPTIKTYYTVIISICGNFLHVPNLINIITLKGYVNK